MDKVYQRQASKASFKVAAIILAAGCSSRMNISHSVASPNGKKPANLHKLLAKIGGETLIHKVVAAVQASKCAVAKLITGYRAGDIHAAVEDLTINAVYNQDYTSGMASSIKLGLIALDDKTIDGVLIVLGDMPLLTSPMIDQLLDCFEAHFGQAIIRAACGDKMGNPVIFPKALFDDLAQLQGDCGARTLLKTTKLKTISVDIGEAALVDVDTIETLTTLGGTFAP